MKQLMMIVFAIFMASCCTTKEFIANEKTEAKENCEYLKKETPMWIEDETTEFSQKVSAFPSRVKDHGEYHGQRFMTTLSNFISRESEKIANIGNCK